MFCILLNLSSKPLVLFRPNMHHSCLRFIMTYFQKLQWKLIIVLNPKEEEKTCRFSNQRNGFGKLWRATILARIFPNDPFKILQIKGSNNFFNIFVKSGPTVSLRLTFKNCTKNLNFKIFKKIYFIPFFMNLKIKGYPINSHKSIVTRFFN